MNEIRKSNRMGNFETIEIQIYRETITKKKKSLWLQPIEPQISFLHFLIENQTSSEKQTAAEETRKQD